MPEGRRTTPIRRKGSRRQAVWVGVLMTGRNSEEMGRVTAVVYGHFVWQQSRCQYGPFSSEPKTCQASIVATTADRPPDAKRVYHGFTQSHGQCVEAVVHVMDDPVRLKSWRLSERPVRFPGVGRSWSGRPGAQSPAEPLGLRPQPGSGNDNWPLARVGTDTPGGFRWSSSAGC